MLKLLLLSLILMSACTSDLHESKDEPNHANVSIPSESTNISIVKESDMFHISFSVDTDIITTTEISSFEGEIANQSDTSYILSHGYTLFDFFITDESGKRINNTVRPHILKQTRLEAGHVAKERYQFQIQKPGNYVIHTVAKFKIDSEGNETKFELESKKVQITVSE